MADRETRDMEKCLKRTPKKNSGGGGGVSSGSARGRKHNSYHSNRRLDYYDNANEDAASTSSPANCNSEQLMTYGDVYHSISLMNGEINRMDLSEMKHRCRELNLHPMGKREAVKRRLKEYYKERLLVEAGVLDPRENRNVDYFVVIDFEATCEERNPTDYKHEIIEFPAVLVSSSNGGSIVDIFHEYCRPVINPTLSEFCRSLTGIEQSTVDEADEFKTVHARFLDWMFVKHELGSSHTYTIVTDGPFDMGRFLFLQCRHLGLEFPHYGNCWANIRKAFANYYKSDFYSSNGAPSSTKLPGLQTMLEMVGLEFEGQPHSGVDDAKNIARVLLRMIADRAFVRVNEKIVIRAASDPEGEADSVKLRSVAPVSRQESEQWFKKQKQLAKLHRKHESKR